MKKIAGIIISLLTIILVTVLNDFGLDAFLSTDSFLFVMGISIGFAVGGKDGETILKRFGQGAVHGGNIGFLLGLILTLGSVDNLEELGPALAFCVLTLLYGWIIKMICDHFE